MSEETPIPEPVAQPSWNDLFEENQKLRQLCVKYQEKLDDLPSAQLLHMSNRELALRAERAEDKVSVLTARVEELEQQAAVLGQGHDAAALAMQLQQVTSERDDLLEETRSLRVRLEELDGGPVLSFS